MCYNKTKVSCLISKTIHIYYCVYNSLFERSVRIVMRHAKPIFNLIPKLNQFISNPYARFIFHILTLIYLELVFRLWIFNTLLNAGTLYSILFSLPAGTLAFVLSSFFSVKANRILTVILAL